MNKKKPNENWRYVMPRPKPLTPAEKKGCVIYARVSTAKQEEGIESQLIRIADSIERGGFRVLKTITAYPEGGGADERPSLDELLSFCKEHATEIGYVFMTMFKRASRQNYRWAETERQLRDMHIAVFSVDLGISTETPLGRFIANMDVAMGEMELVELSKKALGSKERLRREGCPSFQAPRGYNNGRYDRVTPTLFQDEQIAGIILHAFRMIADGQSVTEVLEYAYLAGLRSRSGGRLSRQTMMSILQNPVYAGFMKPGPEGGELIRGNWIPIVSEELFDAVQDRLNRTARSGSRNRSPNPEFPLATVLACPVCGSRISGYNMRGHRYYRCRKDSSHLHVNAEVPESAVSALLLDVSLGQGANEIALPVFESRMESIHDSIRLCTRRLRQLERASQAAADRLTDSRTDAATTIELISGYNEQIEQLARQRRTLYMTLEAGRQVLERACVLLHEPGLAWVAADAKQRRLLARMLFPKGLTFDPAQGFPHITDELTPIFRVALDPEVGTSEGTPRSVRRRPLQSSTAESPPESRPRKGLAFPRRKQPAGLTAHTGAGSS